MRLLYFIDTSVLNLSRLKYLCLLFTSVYILGFLGMLTLKFSITPYPVTKTDFKEQISNSTSISTTILISTSTTTSTTESPEAEVISQKNEDDIDLLKMGSGNSKEELDFLLNIRKLISFAVYDLNEPFKSMSCVKWWANPMDIFFYKVLVKTDSYIQQEMKFRVHPGYFRFRVVLIQKLPPLETYDDEFQIVSPLEPLDKFPFAYCNGADEFINTVRATCLCSSVAEMDDFQNLTAVHRSNRNFSDKESVSWPPNASLSIPDYLNFTNYKFFHISPGKKDVKHSKYSKNYCGPEVKLLIMISSAPDRVKQRKYIRRTFANLEYLREKGVKVVFLMGQPKTRTAKNLLIKESKNWNDIIMANFVDSYHNRTLSHLSMFQWVYLTCGQGNIDGISMPKHILKADDNVVLNVDLALRVAENNPDVEFIGRLICGKKVNRDFESSMDKFYTPRYMHLANYYTGYLSGAAYLMRSDVIPRLLHIATNTPLIHSDDVYVTGILLRQLKIYPRHSPLFSNKRVKPHSCLTKKKVSSLVLNLEDMLDKWEMHIEPSSECLLNNLPLKVQEFDENKKRKCFFD